MKLKLYQKISLSTIALILVAVVITVSVSSNWYLNQMMKSIKDNTLNITKTASMSSVIIQGLQTDDDGSIQTYIQSLQESVDNIDIMVVASVDGTRFGHTKNDRVGKPFSANDHQRAIINGETYATIGPGTLGDSLRAFAPIKADDGSILGFVMVGTLLDSIDIAKLEIFKMLILFIFIGSFTGMVGSFFLSNTSRKHY